MTKEFIRYHYEFGFPDYIGEMCLDFFKQFKELNTTFHSAARLLEDKNGAIPMPTMKDLLNPTNTLVEVYENSNEFGTALRTAKKLVIRVHHLDERKDFSYVVARDGFIISAWVNSKTDIHRLLKRDVYHTDFSRVEQPKSTQIVDGV